MSFSRRGLAANVRPMSHISNPPYPRITLKKGAHKRLLSGHPWIYSNEVNMDLAAKALPLGSFVTISEASGKPLATAYFNSKTLIAARVLSLAPDVAIDTAFISARFNSALKLRTRLFDEPFYRLVHAEADGLPGLVVDRFDNAYVLQPNTAGMEALIDVIVSSLKQTLLPHTIVIRGDSVSRKLEGLEDSVRCVLGESSAPVAVRENGVTFFADLMTGQKTGWFFDQRDNHAFIASLSGGASVLDLYTHTGGFALACASAGATSVTAVDRSATALKLARKAAVANQLTDRCTFKQNEVFPFLDEAVSNKQNWDVVIADPPPFIKSKKDLKAGLQGYRKLSRLCALTTAPGGFLFVASCSHNAPLEEFTAAVVRRVADAGRSGRVIRTSGAGPDHPIHALLPESAYLKALVLQLD